MSIFKTLGDAIGVPDDQVRMITGFLLCVPIGFGFQNVNGRNLRINLGSIIGLILTYMVYSEMILSVLIQTVIVYVMVKNLGKRCGWPVFVETLLFLSVHHLYRQVTDYGGWKMDVTTILMMNTCKWTSFAWCVVDGMQDEERLTDDQKLRRIRKLPSFVEYFGYIFFYCGCLAGPAYDYYEYDEFMDQRGVYAVLPSKKEIGFETLRLLKNAVITAALMVSSQIYLPMDYLTTQEFGQYNFFVKTIWMSVVVTLYRTRFMSGWSFSEASLAASGFTYNGRDEKTKKPMFGRIRSIDFRMEVTHDIQEKLKYWNMSVQQWLSRYVYQRVHDPASLRGNIKKQNQAQMATYLTSAFWHGFYPGYYISFVQWGIVSINAKYFYRASLNTNIFDGFSKNRFTKLVRFYLVNTVFNGIGCGLILLSVDKTVKSYSNLYWIPNILNVLVFLFFTFTLFGQKSSKTVTGNPANSDKPKVA